MPFAEVAIPIAPVTIIAVLDPSIEANASPAGKVEDVVYTVTAGFWAKGGLGVGGQSLQSGIIKDGGPTQINSAVEHDEEVTTVTVEIVDPNGQKRVFTNGLYFRKDAWMVCCVAGWPALLPGQRLVQGRR